MRHRLSLSILLAPILLVPVAATPALAAGPHEICIALAGGAAGARVGLPIVLDDGGGVAGLQVDVRYDPSLLAPAGVRLGADTLAAGSWTADSQARSPGLLTVIAYSNPPAALAAGYRQVVVALFDVLAASPIKSIPLPLGTCVLGDTNGLGLPCVVCVQPGVDAAAPRFGISLVDDGLLYTPAHIVVETGDWVLWENVGSFLFHTTTSGIRDAGTRSCTADGVWRGELHPGQQFARRFPEPPSSLLPYFCEPDCSIGQTGDVLVTDPIVLTAGDASGTSRLTWRGGSGLYVVSRSDTPAFVGPATRAFAPDGGDAGTSLFEPTLPAPGTALFYLVNNKF